MSDAHPLVEATLTIAVRRPHRYTFAEVLDYTKVTRNRLVRWLDAGILETAGGGSQGKRREFSFRNLVEVVVCDELRGFGVNEEVLGSVVRALNNWWSTDMDQPINWQQPDGPKFRDATVIWIAFQRVHFPQSGEDAEQLCIYPVDAATLVSRVTDGLADPWGSGIAESGMAIPLRRIITNLEKATGDEFR